MSPRPDISPARKATILDAALHVFSRSGFHRARMDDIAAEAGLSKGALYWYYASKDALITALLENLFATELDALEDIRSAPGSAAERLQAYALRAVRDFGRVALLRPIVYEFYAAALRQPAVRAALQQVLRRYLEAVEPLVEQGIRNGEFRPVDPGATALAAGALLEGTILLWIWDPQRVDLEAQTEAGMRLLLDGLQRH